MLFGRFFIRQIFRLSIPDHDNWMLMGRVTLILLSDEMQIQALSPRIPPSRCRADKARLALQICEPPKTDRLHSHVP